VLSRVNSCWSWPAQPFLILGRTELMIIFYFLWQKSSVRIMGLHRWSTLSAVTVCTAEWDGQQSISKYR
jgi:hypothetical protein